MINLYSNNVTSTTNMIMQWNNKSVQRGSSATLDADGQTIRLNEEGVYKVTVNGYGSTTAAGAFGFQLVGDGANIVRAAGGTTTGAGELGNISFATDVAVNKTYGAAAKASIRLVYTGGAGTINLASIIVEKVA